MSGGIAIGPAYVLEGGIAQVPEFAVEPADLEAEVERFKSALAKARRQIRKLRRKAEALPDSVLEELGPLLDAHGAMLDSSRLAGGVESAIRARSVNAEAAVQSVVGELVRGLEAVGDAYLASRGQDIREVGDRILRHLTATPYHAFSLLAPGTIVVAEELSPADTALMDPARVAGFATALGGADSHTAIMARSMGIPAVLGVPAVSTRVRSGCA